jgi:hypothetical protein
VLSAYGSRVPQKPEFLDYNFGVGLEGKGWETSLRSFNKVSSLQFALFNKVKPSVTVGATLDYQFDKNTQASHASGRPGFGILQAAYVLSPCAYCRTGHDDWRRLQARQHHPRLGEGVVFSLGVCGVLPAADPLLDPPACI